MGLLLAAAIAVAVLGGAVWVVYLRGRPPGQSLPAAAAELTGELAGDVARWAQRLFALAWPGEGGTAFASPGGRPEVKVIDLDDVPAPAEPIEPPPAPPADGDYRDVPVLEGTTAAVPPHWAAVANYLADLEPEDAEHLIHLMQDEAAGVLAYADGIRAFAETLLTVIGLDPVVIQAFLELADVMGDTAHDVGLALHRFMVLYGDMIEGPAIPRDARRWLQGLD
jgi:hypothetical protein